MPRYLGYLVSRLADAGVAIEHRTANSLSQAAEAAPVVVNCSGLGACELPGDAGLRPVFGQHVVLSNPGLDALFMELTTEPERASYFPHPDRVVCGGISVAERWDCDPDPEVTHPTLARCRRVEPRLYETETLETVTELRPDRPSVRVEAEELGPARCVHNYGHGGSAVSLSWGCAHEAAQLAQP
jgi:D-amino-acid oxidase